VRHNAIIQHQAESLDFCSKLTVLFVSGKIHIRNPPMDEHRLRRTRRTPLVSFALLIFLLLTNKFSFSGRIFWHCATSWIWSIFTTFIPLTFSFIFPWRNYFFWCWLTLGVGVTWAILAVKIIGIWLALTAS